MATPFYALQDLASYIGAILQDLSKLRDNIDLMHVTRGFVMANYKELDAYLTKH